jgi:hypothetical protein
MQSRLFAHIIERGDGGPIQRRDDIAGAEPRGIPRSAKPDFTHQQAVDVSEIRAVMIRQRAEQDSPAGKHPILDHPGAFQHLGDSGRLDGGEAIAARQNQGDEVAIHRKKPASEHRPVQGEARHDFADGDDATGRRDRVPEVCGRERFRLAGQPHRNHPVAGLRQGGRSRCRARPGQRSRYV